MTGIFITRDGGSGGGGGGEAGGGVGLLGSFSGWTVGLGRKGLNLDKAKAIAPETGGCTGDGGGPGDNDGGGPGEVGRPRVQSMGASVSAGAGEDTTASTRSLFQRKEGLSGQAKPGLD